MEVMGVVLMVGCQRLMGVWSRGLGVGVAIGVQLQ